MRFFVTMKSPDALDYALQDCSSEEEMKQIRELCSRWFEYGEYLSVEIDTEAETCVVVER